MYCLLRLGIVDYYTRSYPLFPRKIQKIQDFFNSKGLGDFKKKLLLPPYFQNLVFFVFFLGIGHRFCYNKARKGVLRGNTILYFSCIFLVFFVFFLYFLYFPCIFCIFLVFFVYSLYFLNSVKWLIEKHTLTRAAVAQPVIITTS